MEDCGESGTRVIEVNTEMYFPYVNPVGFCIYSNATSDKNIVLCQNIERKTENYFTVFLCRGSPILFMHRLYVLCAGATLAKL